MSKDLDLKEAIAKKKQAIEMILKTIKKNGKEKKESLKEIPSDSTECAEVLITYGCETSLIEHSKMIVKIKDMAVVVGDFFDKNHNGLCPIHNKPIEIELFTDLNFPGCEECIQSRIKKIPKETISDYLKRIIEKFKIQYTPLEI